MPYAAINGQQLFYRDTGGNAPALMFSHGLLMDQEMFAPQIGVLQRRFRCVSWDERGHGQTATDHIEPFSYYDSADDLAGLLDYLGIRQAVLVGMSQGGYLSLRCALTHPDRVRALVLIDTQASAEAPERIAGYRKMLDSWTKHGLSDRIAEATAQAILGPAWPGTAYWQQKWRQWQPHNLRACFEALIARDDIGDRLADIDKPAQVIHGEADQAIPLARARDMADRLPGSTFVSVPEAGHAANLTHPQPCNAAIARFLDDLPAAE